MPTYEYACTACGHRLEAVQRFTDEPLTVCPECGGALRKVYGAVGIVLKGSGFYKTDSRAAASNGSGTKKESGDSGSAGSGEVPTSTGTKKEGGESGSKDSGSKDSGSKDSSSKDSGSKDSSSKDSGKESRPAAASTK